ncbi:hypothetical protein L873DRAFT_1843546 [Choiromyces venosus 120613-1]|uniref:Uncharacterized protein n=1 Tax=Choiromyces venosus 120613-1 TaxID=1336337 RepID=A0A3N4JMF5_9PEZI|nr:hypothetical protein L873DRAFT_1843546 [Choiromyces venosus 120613-1]
MTIPTTPPQPNKIERKKEKKRGPKPKRLYEHHSHAAKIKPPKRQEKAWSQAQKIWVLTFLFHHQVPTTPTIHSSNNSADLLRPPTQIEASKLFGIPQRTISECVKNKEKIEGLGNGTYTNLCTSKNKSIFKFSNGWFEGFLGRYKISLRTITKKAQKILEDYKKLVINWLRFNRRNSQPDPITAPG